jgi:hypothetical protein
MKIIILILLTCGVHICGIAQVSFERIVNQSCACMQTKGWNTDKISMQTQTDSCLNVAIIYNFSDLEKEMAINFNDGRAGQLFGEKLGKALYKDCAVYRLYLEQVTELEMKEVLYSKSSQKGKLEVIKTDMQGQRMNLCIRTAADSLLCFAWLRQFKNDSLFIQNDASLKGRELNIFYEYQNLFNYRQNLYEQVAVILDIEIYPVDTRQDNFINPNAERQRLKAAKIEQKQKIRIAKQQLKAMRKQKIG